MLCTFIAGTRGAQAWVFCNTGRKYGENLYITHIAPIFTDSAHSKSGDGYKQSKKESFMLYKHLGYKTIQYYLPNYFH